MTLKADLDAMQHDSKQLTQISDTIDSANTNLDTISLKPSDFSFWGMWDPYSTYSDLVQKINSLLIDGSQQFSGAARAINTVREAFANNDTEAAKRFAETWIPNP